MEENVLIENSLREKKIEREENKEKKFSERNFPVEQHVKGIIQRCNRVLS